MQPNLLIEVTHRLRRLPVQASTSQHAHLHFIEPQIRKAFGSRVAILQRQHLTGTFHMLKYRIL
jgi:hypothetical protein